MGDVSPLDSIAESPLSFEKAAWAADALPGLAFSHTSSLRRQSRESRFRPLLVPRRAYFLLRPIIAPPLPPELPALLRTAGLAFRIRLPRSKTIIASPPSTYSASAAPPATKYSPPQTRTRSPVAFVIDGNQ